MNRYLQGTRVLGMSMVDENDVAMAERSGLVMGALGGIAIGALAWRSHRVWGALLGGIVVGPSVGRAVGNLVARISNVKVVGK